MERNSIRIQKRIPAVTYEMAMIAYLEGTLTNDYIKELAAHECEGEVRRKKAGTVIKFLTVLNPMQQYLKGNADAIISVLKRKEDRNLMFIAQLSAAYPFVYDIVSAFGRIFHAQDQVSGSMIVNKLGEKYGSNAQLEVSFRSVLPMMVEAGFLKKEKPGLFSINKFKSPSHLAYAVYKQSFLINNPNVNPENDFLSNSYFEYIQL